MKMIKSRVENKIRNVKLKGNWTKKEKKIKQLKWKQENRNKMRGRGVDWKQGDQIAFGLSLGC